MSKVTPCLRARRLCRSGNIFSFFAKLLLPIHMCHPHTHMSALCQLCVRYGYSTVVGWYDGVLRSRSCVDLLTQDPKPCPQQGKRTLIALQRRKDQPGRKSWDIAYISILHLCRRDGYLMYLSRTLYIYDRIDIYIYIFYMHIHIYSACRLVASPLRPLWPPLPLQAQLRPGAPLRLH